MQKVYLNDNNTITVSCPRCQKTKDIDAIPFLKSKGLVKLNFRFKCEYCDCGHIDCKECKEANCASGNTNMIAIDRRKFYRKKVNLPGFFLGEKGKRFSIRVLDLSRTGLRAKILTPNTFQVDQKLQVQFTLDDAKETNVQKYIVVRKTDGKVVDGEFTDSDAYDKNDKAIGFYLMM